MSAPPPHSILVVDDTPENITVLRTLLAGQGYRVRPALRGELAVKAARAEPPDLVLLDIMMPDMDGFAVCQALKEDPATRDIPVLFISALDRIDDKLKGFRAGGVDYISKPFQAEEVLARVHTHLSLRAAQRQLERQNRELQEATALQADVERILRHDLKGPLGNIINFAELLLEGEALAGEPKASVGTIREAAFRMLAMVNSSFDLLKMERGTYEFRPVAVDLLAVLHRLWAELRLSAGQKHLRWECLLDGRAVPLDRPPAEAPAWLLGDELLCHSLWANLAKNAVEAAPPGSALRWTVETGPETVRVRLRNAGAVPATLRPRFFEKYATEGKAGGTGLGTYSAKLMTQTQGGAIALDDREPGHTSIEVVLPAAPPGLVARQTQRPGDDVPPGAAGPVAVLAVDDDPAVLAFLRAQLAPPKWALTTVPDGPAALRQVQAGTFAAIILDWQLPGWDGATTAAKIRQWERQDGRAPCPLLGLSAEVDGDVRAQARAAGYDDILAKPITGPALRAALVRLLVGFKIDSRAPFRQGPVEVDADLADVLPEALAGWREQVGELRRRAAAGEVAAVRSLAHRLKGGLALYRLTVAADLATRVDAAALQSPDALPPELFADLERLAEYLRDVQFKYIALD